MEYMKWLIYGDEKASYSAIIFNAVIKNDDDNIFQAKEWNWRGYMYILQVL